MKPTDLPNPPLTIALAELCVQLAGTLSAVADDLAKDAPKTCWSCLPVAATLDKINFHVGELRKTVRKEFSNLEE